MTNYQVISTKCPVLNKAFRNACASGSPDLEVMVKLEENTPKAVICPEYTPERTCARREAGCIYKEGWKTLNF